MKSFRTVALCTLFFVAMLGVAFAQQVKTDFDHQANFSQHKTYSWQEIKPTNSLWNARIKSAVDAQLAAKGWAQAEQRRRCGDRSDCDESHREDTSDFL
jgi:hypothetical protein